MSSERYFNKLRGGKKTVSLWLEQDTRGEIVRDETKFRVL